MLQVLYFLGFLLGQYARDDVFGWDADLRANSTSGGRVVARDHPNRDVATLDSADGGGGIGTKGVRDREHGCQSPRWNRGVVFIRF